MRPQRGNRNLTDIKDIRRRWLRACVIGLIVGLVAKLPTAGRNPGGFIITAIIGILGALLATWAGQNVRHGYRQDESAGFLAPVLGAIVLLLIQHLVKHTAA